MKLISMISKYTLALVVAGVLTAGPVMADKGGNGKGGNGKGGKHDRGDQRDERRDDDKRSNDDNDRHSSGKNRHFDERQNVMVREYYFDHYRDARRCPPGLAKKHNGCMPPGHAKNWKVGRTLAREVIFYEVPQPLVVQIGLPPAGHRYVRVAGDILLIAIGTGMVVDAINDLGGM